jgi:hypothetical protein
MVSRYPLRIALGTLLAVAVASTAFGQCTNGVPPCKAPSNTGAVVWVVVSVAVGALTIYVLHKSKSESRNQPRNQPSIVGCTELTENGTVLTDEKDSQPYVILPGSVTLKPGERVEVLGAKDEDSAGRIALNVSRLVKDYGPCKLPKAVAAPK